MVDTHGPATPNQKDYARRLGVTFDDDITFGDLSTLIDAASKLARPSPRQVEFATSLGVEFDSDTTTARELRKLIDAEVARQSRRALDSNPVLRVGETILYKGHAYRIDEFNRRRWRARLVPCFRMKGVRTVWVLIITIRDAERVEVLLPEANAR